MKIDTRTLSKKQVMKYIPPLLRENVEELLKASCLKPLRITTINKNKEEYINRFMLFIPFGGCELQWEVSYNLDDDNLVPDFEFLNDTFLSDPDIDVIVNHVPSLANWDVKNPKCLLSVITEFLKLYKQINLQRLENDYKFTKPYAEYKQLLDNTPYTAKDVEICIEDDVVNILISINIDPENLLNYIQQFHLTETKDKEYQNPGKDYALLKVTFHATRTVVNLNLSPRLEQHLGGSGTLHMPPYTAQLGLANYASKIQTLLEERIEIVKKNQKAKQDFINTILAVQGCSILSYDAARFNYVNLLLEVDDFAILVSITINDRFPTDKPVVTLKSSCHELNDRPRGSIFDVYPYSPRWTGEEMALRLLTALEDELPKFKETCSQPIDF